MRDKIDIIVILLVVAVLSFVGIAVYTSSEQDDIMQEYSKECDGYFFRDSNHSGSGIGICFSKEAVKWTTEG